MYKRLRDDLGLVYSTGFSQTYKWKAGMLVGYIGCKSDRTRRAIQETVKIMDELQKNVPKKELELKRLDVLNSFVFNVDTSAALVNVYGRYHMRKEPMDTLERIQDTYISARKQDLEVLAKKYLDPKNLQIVVVADKTTKVIKENGIETTLEDDLMSLAKALCLPYREIPLR